MRPQSAARMFNIIADQKVVQNPGSGHKPRCYGAAQTSHDTERIVQVCEKPRGVAAAASLTKQLRAGTAKRKFAGWWKRNWRPSCDWRSTK